jgi:hypothetical protein
MAFFYLMLYDCIVTVAKPLIKRCFRPVKKEKLKKYGKKIMADVRMLMLLMLLIDVLMLMLTLTLRGP